jgi:CelD/BcsL family acetyltransferase involved in cellulose biosynthesis
MHCHPPSRDRSSFGDIEIIVDEELGSLFEPGAMWDQLLAHSQANTIFLTSGWLRAWAETYGQGARLLIPQIWRKGQLIAAAAFQHSNGIITFAGIGPSDYLDIAVDPTLDSHTASSVITELLDAARTATPHFRCFWLERIPLENGTFARLSAPGSRYYVTRLGGVQAPSMDMSAATEKLQKKSLRRHERAFERQGNVQTETFTHAAEILPRLHEFFDQHVRRWLDTSSPSLFTTDTARAFYTTLTRYLDKTDWLRFTDIRLDGRLAAAHFGFFYAGRFIWYKPTYEPALAKHSPGEVLLKRLIEKAQADNATEFDFTIGEEAFKYRFATKVRDVVTLHITDSFLGAAIRRARSAIGRRLRRYSDSVRGALRRAR